MKKIIATLTSAALLISGLGVEPFFASTPELFNHTFEDGLSGWAGRGDAVVELSTDYAHDGSSTSLLVTGRTEIWNGALLETDTLVAGSTYHISGWASYKNQTYGQQKFELCLQYDQGEAQSYPVIASGTAYSGSWGQMDCEITIPMDATNIALYVQTSYNPNPTTQDYMDFYIDDLKCEKAPDPEIEHDLPSLKALYQDYFKFGTAIMGSEVGIKPTEDLIDLHFNNITFGNELKPDSVLNQSATLEYLEETGDQTNPQVSFARADKLLRYAAENSLPVRGHTLVWHSQTPDWFFKEDYSNDGDWVSKDIMIKRMENYIKNVMEGLAKNYPDVEFYAWDVVNEAISDTGTARDAGSNLEKEGASAWVQVFGDNSFIEYAFTFARKYAPEGCKLFYNDYNEYMYSKMNAIAKMVTDLYSKGLIDGMGMQAHLDMWYPMANDFETALKKYCDIGVEVQVTELDITQSDTTENGMKQQGDKYKEIFDVIKKVKLAGGNITNVVIWGMLDSNSWRASRCPLLFDKDYKAKPAYYSITEGMEMPAVVTTVTKKTTVTTTTEPPVTTLYGDINKSGKVDLSDLVTLNQYLVKDITLTSSELLLADVTADGFIDVADVALMKQYLMGDKVILGKK